MFLAICDLIAPAIYWKTQAGMFFAWFKMLWVTTAVYNHFIKIKLF